jgi:xanthine dehydrogenase iron-sulfur cluster and FAD-binding subunit A
MKGNQIDEVRIALGSVAPIPIRCLQTEDTLRGKVTDANTVKAAGSALTRDISPIDDVRSTRDYRLAVSLNLLGDFLQNLSPSP